MINKSVDNDNNGSSPDLSHQIVLTVFSTRAPKQHLLMLKRQRPQAAVVIVMSTKEEVR